MRWEQTSLPLGAALRFPVGLGGVVRAGDGEDVEPAEGGAHRLARWRGKGVGDAGWRGVRLERGVGKGECMVG